MLLLVSFKMFLPPTFLMYSFYFSANTLALEKNNNVFRYTMCQVLGEETMLQRFMDSSFHNGQNGGKKM